jgi:hypothetical protein
MTWTDGSPTAWIVRVRPYVTSELDAHNQQYLDAGGGTDWHDIVTQRCTRSVNNVAAVIPPESPRTAAAVNVHVTGTVTTTCITGKPRIHNETVSATLVTTPGPDGTWRVHQRLY